MANGPIEKIYEDVQLHIAFSQAASRSNIVTYDSTAQEPENISTAFGKLSKWYEALVPTGGSSGKILAWNSSGTAKWSDPLHPTITKSADTTSTASPAHGGTFTTVDSVTRDANGHVTKINTKTVTLPSDQNTDTLMTQTNTTGSADYRVLLSGNANDTTETTTGRKSTNLKFNPSTGVLSASSGVTTKTITRSALKGMLTGSGTAAQDKGSGVSPRYFPAKWTFNTGLTAANGDVFIIKLPTAGHSYGVFLSIDNGANYYPISVNGTSRLTTHYRNGYSIAVMFKSDGSTADVFPLAGGDSRSTVTGGCWQVLNYYDSGNTNTTYTFATGDAVGQIKVTPSGGTATNYNVNGIAAGTSSGTANHLAYYDSATSITSAGNIVYSVRNSTASTPRSRTILNIFNSNTVGNDASALISGTKGVLSYGDGGPQINFSTTGTIGGAQDSAIIWTDNDSAAAGASWHFVSSQSDWNVISKRFHARTGISIGTDLPQTSYNLYVNGTAFHSDGITFGSTTNVVDPVFSIYTRTASNYNTTVKWSNGSTWGTYGAEIGYHNAGGDSTNPGTICVLPYQTETNPWGGQVGLFIKKDHVYIDGVELSKSGHTHSYIPMSGSMSVTGNIEITKASGDVGFYAKRSDTGVEVWMGVGSGGTNHGIYSNKLGKWMMYGDATNVYLNGNAVNVTGTVAIANGGTGATTRLGALRALTEENVGTSAQYFLTITDSWGKGGYTTVADAKSVLGIGAATSSGTANQLAYYSGANTISAAHNGTNTVDSLYFKTGTNAKSARQIILGIYGQTYGNDAAGLISGTAGVFSYGDGGPQIDFNSSVSGSQAGALIFTDHDSAATGASWHFVSNQTDWNVTSKRFHARTGISIGTNLPNTSYNLYVNGTTGVTGVITSTYKSSTYVTSLTSSAITLSDTASSFGGWICGPTKNGRIVISSYQGDNDKLYFGYGERGRTTNSYVKAMTWDGPTNTLTADKFVGALQGNATTATTAGKLSNTSAIGSSTQPVYFNENGVPVACTQDANQAHFSTVPFVRNDGVMEVGRYFDMHSTNTGTTDYDVRLDASGVSSFRFTFNTPTSSSIAPSTNNQTSLGTSSLKWSNVYATTFYGALSGNASTATKLETARNIALAEDFAGSADFDGSGNISISGTFYRCSASSNNTANYPWHRIAYRTGVTGNYNDTDAIFMIRAYYNGGPFGIIKVTMRTNGSGANCQVAARWLVRQNIAANDVYIAQWGKTGQSVYADIFLKGTTYNRTYVYQIAGSRSWTLVNSGEASDTTTSDKKTSTEVYASIAAAGTTLHNQAYTQTVAGIDEGHVNSANSATYATRADYVNVVASNEIRFYNDNQFKANNHFWLGYSWAAGSHYTPSGGSDTSSTTAPNITEFVMGNCTAGGLASVHAKTFILGNGSSPTKSSKTTTIATAATTTDRTITLPDANGNVILGTKGSTGFWGLIDGDGSTSNWIRGTSNGFIPSAGAKFFQTATSSLGTNTWYFKNSYIQYMTANSLVLGAAKTADGAQKGQLKFFSGNSSDATGTVTLECADDVVHTGDYTVKLPTWNGTIPVFEKLFEGASNTVSLSYSDIDEYDVFLITVANSNATSEQVTVTSVWISNVAGVHDMPLIWGGAPTSSGGACNVTSGWIQLSKNSGTTTFIVAHKSNVAQMTSSGWSISSPTYNLYIRKIFGLKTYKRT